MSSVPSKKILHGANVCFSAHAIAQAQPCIADPQTVKHFKRYKGYEIYCIYDIKFGMLQVRENDISIRKWSGGTAHLRSLERALWWKSIKMFEPTVDTDFCVIFESLTDKAKRAKISGDYSVLTEKVLSCE